MITCTWRTKLALAAGVAFLPASLMLALAPAASASPGARASAPAASASHRARASASPRANGPGNGNPPATRNGDNGTVKIHKSTTPVTDPRNEPHVCLFYLDGFGFDAGQSVSWHIESWPPTGNRSTVAQGALVMDGNGNGNTLPPMGLPNGHYKLFWNFTGEHGFAKQKVFWVRCPAPTPTPPPSTPGTTPPSSPPGTPPSVSAASSAAAAPSAPGHSGLPITGWPLALIAGAAAVLLGTGGTAIVISRRRRGLHSSQ